MLEGWQREKEVGNYNATNVMAALQVKQETFAKH